jgi:hypothetical protein
LSTRGREGDKGEKMRLAVTAYDREGLVAAARDEEMTVAARVRIKMQGCVMAWTALCGAVCVFSNGQMPGAFDKNQ